ncbi:hypothetical protein [Gloeobacter kilaueensis]|uniref:JAB domain-containing protein n=1 Tax=Gloeobacter kilaueensis (strain ATCC BAA-2537 / CCAP 1431/1 / ULC 316 / JS1) TaxID=1183438 RepID=U5QK03_GLOK1|nr:hypothetical protein [Gloeobacter kilaueensis]AGY57995.1 hypothetical protein GKIL_1749 [Gloeobacter kilaueensis JS1]
MIRYLPLAGPLPPALPYGWDYLFAQDGVGLRARRTGLEVCMPLSCGAIRLQGLRPLRPYFSLEYPRVPATCLQAIVAHSLAATDHDGRPLEALFYLKYSLGAWQLRAPATSATSTSVIAVDRHDSDADVELHSHHAMTPRFSLRDDEEEQGFRIYAVIGHLFTTPALHVRVGCFGHFWSIPAASVFEMPVDIIDYLEIQNG